MPGQVLTDADIAQHDAAPRSLTDADIAAFDRDHQQTAHPSMGHVADFISGVGAGGIGTVLGAYELLRKIPGAEKVLPAISDEVLSYAEPPDTVSAKVGKFLEQGAEFAVPAGAAADVAKGAGLAGKMAAQAVAAGTVRGVQTGGDVGQSLDAAALGAAGPVVAKGAGAAMGLLKKNMGLAPDVVGLVSPRAAHALRIGSKIANAVSKAAPEAEAAAPAAATAAEDAQLLDGLAQGFGKTSFKRATAEEQATIRDLAERIKAGETATNPQKPTTTATSPVTPTPENPAANTAAAPPAAGFQPVRLKLRVAPQGPPETAPAIKSPAIESQLPEQMPAAAAPEPPPAATPKPTAPGDYPKAGAQVSGLTVRDAIPNLRSIDSSLENPEELPGVREVPLSAFTDASAKGNFYAADDFRRVHQLAQQIKQSGEINPLIVVMDEKGPYVLEGGHRLSALDELGVKSLPAKVVIDRNAIPAAAPAPELPESWKPTPGRMSKATMQRISDYQANARARKTDALVKFLYDANGEAESGVSYKDAAKMTPDQWKLAAKGARVNDPSPQTVRQVLQRLKDMGEKTIEPRGGMGAMKQYRGTYNPAALTDEEIAAINRRTR
jgi:hypothetical protein